MANYISSLSDDLLVEILCRFGFSLSKQAIQCKSVCKLWSSIINTKSSSSYFSQRWLQINHGNDTDSSLPVTLITSYETRRAAPRRDDHPLESRYDMESLSFDFLPPHGRSGNKNLCVLGCDKDLVLCCPDTTDHSCYYVCNPLTKQWTALPPVPEEELRDYVHTKGGIVVHGEDGHFTVVRAVASYSTNTRVLVFSSSGGGWRAVEYDKEEIDMERRMLERVVSYKEMVVCLMSRPLRGESGEDYFCLILDPRSGQHNSLPLPQRDPSKMAGVTMGLTQGRLRFSQVVKDEKKLIVWEFNEDGGRKEWEKVEELDLGEGSGDWPMAGNLCQCKGGEVAEAFHPHDRDVLYVLYSRPCWCASEKKGRLFSFSCNLNNEKKKEKEKKRTSNVMIGEISLPGGGFDYKILPLVQQCWPTPIPLFLD